jgi:predicted DNA-binding protein with PD1-like motif
MQAKLLHEQQGEKTFALVFDTGDEVVSGLLGFAKKHHLDSSHFTALGAFSDVVMGYFDWEKKDYRRIPLPEQVEVLALVGDIALEQGEPKVHAHVVVGKREGRPMGAISSKHMCDLPWKWCSSNRHNTCNVRVTRSLGWP